MDNCVCANLLCKRVVITQWKSLIELNVNEKQPLKKSRLNLRKPHILIAIRKCEFQVDSSVIPCTLTTDPGPQFTDRDFETFAKSWAVIQSYIQSSPGHHSANDKAEAAVKIAKYLLQKADRDGTDHNIALLELRNTPRKDNGLSPAQMLFGCETHSVLPCFKC